MGLFGKKSDSESQKEQLRDNIQYNDREPVTEVICCHATEMDNKTFVWKYPGHHFNTMSQLIVNESQEAIFFLNGEALDSFGPGRYTLETQNIPKLSKKIYGSQTGANSHFLRPAGPHFPASQGHIKRSALEIGRARGAPPC